MKIHLTPNYTKPFETESWSGGVAFKLSVSQKYPFPILEVIQPEEYEFPC